MSPARRVRNADGDLTEAGFQAHVIGLARAYGWRVYHAPDNRPAGRTGRPQRLAAPEAVGFPDLVLVRAPRLLFVELKAERGRLGPGQAEWLDELGHAGAEVAVWKPSDWERVQAALGAGQPRRTDLDPLGGTW